MKFEVLSWEETFSKTRELFGKIIESGFKPDIIVGIARGGWIPARLLADYFRSKNTANIKVEGYHQIGDLQTEPKITQDLNYPVENQKILIVDDIADSGESLEIVKNGLLQKNAKEIKIATLYYKNRSKVIPDYYIFETDAWVIFSWEYYETISELYAKWKGEGLTKPEIIEKLIQVGIPSNLINEFQNHYKEALN